MGEVGCLKDGCFQNLETSGNTIINGLHDKNIVEQSGTEDEDLSATTSNLVWFSDLQQAGNITLPQATAQNAGMTIKIIVGTDDWSTDGVSVGVANGKDTVLTGYMRLGSNGSADVAGDGGEVDSFVVTIGTKSLELTSNDATSAGGAIGSTYLFTYLKADLIHVEGSGMCTTGAPTLDSSAFGTGV